MSFYILVLFSSCWHLGWVFLSLVFSTPFAKGSLRFAYHMQEVTAEGEPVYIICPTSSSVNSGEQQQQQALPPPPPPVVDKFRVAAAGAPQAPAHDNNKGLNVATFPSWIFCLFFLLSCCCFFLFSYRSCSCSFFVFFPFCASCFILIILFLSSTCDGLPCLAILFLPLCFFVSFLVELVSISSCHFFIIVIIFFSSPWYCRFVFVIFFTSIGFFLKFCLRFCFCIFSFSSSTS